MGVKQAMKSIDAEDHLLHKNQSGAHGSIIGLVVMEALFLHELRYYITTFLSVDAIDTSGKRQVDLDTNIWKLRLNSYGQIIASEYLSDLVEKEHAHHNHDDDKDHHEHSIERANRHGFDQDAENMIKKVKQALAHGEGCRVYGVPDVQRVAENFHISVHGLNIFVSQMYPGLHNPLDEIVRILHSASRTSKYYIKIVPTEYRYISKEVLPTNQFSVTEYFSPMTKSDQSWPAVYFLYDLSPITATIKEERRSFLHFITRLCAVLGSTFALTGLLRSLLNQAAEVQLDDDSEK